MLYCNMKDLYSNPNLSRWSTSLGSNHTPHVFFPMANLPIMTSSHNLKQLWKLVFIFNLNEMSKQFHLLWTSQWKMLLGLKAVTASRQKCHKTEAEECSPPTSCVRVQGEDKKQSQQSGCWNLFTCVRKMVMSGICYLKQLLHVASSTEAVPETRIQTCLYLCS